MYLPKAIGTCKNHQGPTMDQSKEPLKLSSDSSSSTTTIRKDSHQPYTTSSREMRIIVAVLEGRAESSIERLRGERRGRRETLIRGGCEAWIGNGWLRRIAYGFG
ncbi:hypothetical protein Droror1_Dr00003076 [Drosera rotundifolia]